MGTLNQHRKRPTLQPLDLRGSSLHEVASRYKECRSYLASVGNELAKPESEAIAFYLHNAAYAKLSQIVAPDEPLADYEALMESYHSVIRYSALRMFYYLLLICTRESRHVYSNVAFYSALETSHGAPVVNFLKHIRGATSDGAVAALLTKTPDVPLGLYTDFLYEVFAKGAKSGLFSGGYGGLAWAEVAKVLRNFTHGILSAELMLDTAFTLAHNNGPIFNKGLLFHHYDSYELTRILDVQRAGLMPQFVATIQSVYITAAQRQFRERAEALLGEVFAGPVDWHRVQALGAKQMYIKEAAAQTIAAKTAAIGLAIPGFQWSKAPPRAKVKKKGVA